MSALMQDSGQRKPIKLTNKRTNKTIEIPGLPVAHEYIRRLKWQPEYSAYQYAHHGVHKMHRLMLLAFYQSMGRPDELCFEMYKAHGVHVLGHDSEYVYFH
jgi:hypothetical protein